MPILPLLETAAAGQPWPAVVTAEWQVYQHVLTAIRTGRYAPGQRLVAEEVALETGTSRMPVREALRRLATEGLVLLRPNRGCVVSGLSLDEIFEVFEMRSVLEGLAARLAVPRLTPDALAELQGLQDRMTLSQQEGGEDWAARHAAFHACLCRFSGRPKLMRQIAALHVAIEPYLRIWFHHAAKPRPASETHQRLIDMLGAGDADLAEATIRQHVMNTAAPLAAFLRQEAGHALAPRGASLRTSNPFSGGPREVALPNPAKGPTTP